MGKKKSNGITTKTIPKTTSRMKTRTRIFVIRMTTRIGLAVARTAANSGTVTW